MTCDFGYVTLHLTDVYERDQGIYTCKAYNLAGEAFTSTTIYCTGTHVHIFCEYDISVIQRLSIYYRHKKLYHLHNSFFLCVLYHDMFQLLYVAVFRLLIHD
jgi:hypothetical protein